MKKERLWRYYLGNLMYVLATSGVGMISGAVVLYFSAAIFYAVLSSPETYPGENCAKGTAIGVLSILTGGFLGTIGGTVMALKHPVINKT